MNENFVNTITETLEKESDIIALFLFGSQAKEVGKKGSDYDFFAVLDRNAKDTLREDEIARKAIDSAKEYKEELHLTFQYLFIVDDDKSLMLKISSEGKLLFSKTYLIAPYQQIGLQKYIICKWDVDAKRSGSKEASAKNSRLMISRALYGYTQKYEYNGKRKESRRNGFVDNKTIFGDGNEIIAPEIMFEHLKHAVEKNNGKLKMLNSCYLPLESVNMEPLYAKMELENLLKKGQPGLVFVTSVKRFDSNKIYVKYRAGDLRKNSVMSIESLPASLQKSSFTKKEVKFE